MKLHFRSCSGLLASVLAISLTPAFAGSSGSARGGASDLIATSSPAKEMAKPAPKHSMACGQCRTTWSSVTVQESKGKVAQTLPVERHNCGDCKTTLTTQGHGKAKQEVTAHVCQNATGQSMSGCCEK
jgi:hypothetical protein